LKIQIEIDFENIDMIKLQHNDDDNLNLNRLFL